MPQMFTNCQKMKNGSNEKGIEYTLQGEFDKAVSEFDNVAEPDSVTRFYLGLITFIEEEDLTEEIGIHLLKGVIYSEENKIDEGIDEFSKGN